MDSGRSRVILWGQNADGPFSSQTRCFQKHGAQRYSAGSFTSALRIGVV